MLEDKLPNDEATYLIRSLIDRAERLQDERAEIDDCLKELFLEAKGKGLDPAILKRVLTRRAKDAAAVHEGREIEDLYFNAASSVA